MWHRVIIRCRSVNEARVVGYQFSGEVLEVWVSNGIWGGGRVEESEEETRGKKKSLTGLTKKVRPETEILTKNVLHVKCTEFFQFFSTLQIFN